jgi:hypothetical protein
MSVNETPLTRAYWREELCGKGALYEEFRAVDADGDAQSWRDIDGVVVLGDPDGTIMRGTRSLDNQDVVVIQTKATRLNPYVFGQALLSKDLIRRRWASRSVRSVLICTADDPELRPIVDGFADLKVAVKGTKDGKVGSFGLRRIPGTAEDLANEEHVPVIAPARLARRLRVDGVMARGLGPGHGDSLSEQVTGRDVTSIHSLRDSRGPARLGMWVAGEVILAQRLLTGMGASSARSVVVCRCGDRAVERELRTYATVEVRELG